MAELAAPLPIRRYLRPAKIRNAVRRRTFISRVTGGVKLDQSIPVEWLGTAYGGWPIPMQFVEPDWVVYCLGAGMDVTFETELIKRAGCDVYTFDPGDESAEYVTGLNEPKLHFDQVAIWCEDGTLSMYQSPVTWPASLSASNLDLGTNRIQVPCRSIESLMEEKGHDHIDLLRYHVEGSEYEIFDPQMLREIDVQILGMRFFHTAPARAALKLIKAIETEGYLPVAREGTGFTFVHKGLPERAREARRRRAAAAAAPAHRHARQRGPARPGIASRRDS
jgi:FkbM family methyltransferase